MLRGHLDRMILAVFEGEPLHGYAVMKALQRRSDGALDLLTGTLYPALRRLGRAGYLCSDWSTVAGRRRRTYSLTAAGGRMLADERAEWRAFSSLVDDVLWSADQ